MASLITIVIIATHGDYDWYEDIELEHKYNGRVWSVDCKGMGNFTNIQDAINASNSGDVIQIADGTYWGPLNINKTIKIMGVGSSPIKILSKNEPVIRIKESADKCTVSGFEINWTDKKNKYSLVVVESDYNIIENGTFTSNNSIQIHINSSKGNIIRNSVFQVYNPYPSDHLTSGIYSGSGIEISSDYESYSNDKTSSGYNYIYNNKFNGKNIDITFSNNNVIRKNRISNCDIGISIYQSKENYISQNSYEYNYIDIQDYGSKTRIQNEDSWVVTEHDILEDNLTFWGPPILLIVGLVVGLVITNYHVHKRIKTLKSGNDVESKTKRHKQLFDFYMYQILGSIFLIISFETTYYLLLEGDFEGEKYMCCCCLLPMILFPLAVFCSFRFIASVERLLKDDHEQTTTVYPPKP